MNNMSKINLYNNDYLVQLKELQDNSIDSIVTDPPDFILYKDNESIEPYIPAQEIWEQCLRVLKPGGHLLSFAESITYHRMAVHIEDAGFEIRDQIMWVYGSKKQKETNHEPVVMARKPIEGTVAENVLEHGTGGINIEESRIKGIKRTPGYKNPGSKYENDNYFNYGDRSVQREVDITEGRFPANIIFDEEAGKVLDEQSGELTSGTLKLTAKPFGGKGIYGNYGSIEKNYEPSKGGASRFFYKPKPDEENNHEPIIMARKPLSEKSVAENVLEHGTGGINIEESRIVTDRNKEPREFDKEPSSGKTGSNKAIFSMGDVQTRSDNWLDQGRFPANIIFDEEAGKLLDEQSGELTSGTLKLNINKHFGGGIYNYGGLREKPYESNKGGASRFFYKPKPDEEILFKPTDLLLYLIRLVTPKNGTTLDPFMGFGISGKAAMQGEFSFVGIEREKEYFEIAKQIIETTENK